MGSKNLSATLKYLWPNCDSAVQSHRWSIIMQNYQCAHSGLDRKTKAGTVWNFADF